MRSLSPLLRPHLIMHMIEDLANRRPFDQNRYFNPPKDVPPYTFRPQTFNENMIGGLFAQATSAT
ncbi:hypothetical protein Hanom_Chr02g00141351 [Helianthus anomalus]